MKLRKVAAIGLAVVMTVSMMAGCGNTNETESSKSSVQESTSKVEESTSTVENVEEKSKEIVFPLEETLEVDAMALLAKDAYPYESNIAWQYIEELTNVKFNMQAFSGGEIKEKANLLLSSGDYPEVLYKCSAVDLEKYGKDGVLIPLEDLIREYAPNLCQLLDERDAWNALAASDGHIYSLPNFEMPRSYCRSLFFWINQEWLDKVGKDMPTNRDELYEVLKAFKEQDPNGNGQQDEIPWVIEGGSEINALNEILAYLGDGLYYGSQWMKMDGVMEYLPTTEYFKEDFLKYVKKLYDEGLINDDAFTLTSDQVDAVGKSGANVYGMFRGSGSNRAGAEAEARLKWSSLKPFDTENFALNQGMNKGGFAITDKCENPEVMIAWADFFYSEEGGRVLRMGVEDVSYELNADGTTYKSLKENFENVTYQATLMGGATVPGKIPEIYYLGQDPVANVVAAHDNEELYGEGYGSQSMGVTCVAPIYTEEESETISTISTDISGYVNNYIAETVTGLKSIDDTWDEFQKTLKAMGVDTLIEIRRTAQERAEKTE